MAVKGFDKTERRILHLIAGPGVGKSRIIDELLAQLVKIANDPARKKKEGEMFPKMLHNCIHIPITFANATSILTQYDVDVSTSFAYRLLYAYFLEVALLERTNSNREQSMVLESSCSRYTEGIQS